MASLLACFGSEAACCSLSLISRCCCSLFTSAASSLTRLAYALLFLLQASVALVLRSQWATDQLSKIPLLRDRCPTDTCTGTLAVYRLLFAYAVFHVCLMVATLGVKDSKHPRAVIQNKFWSVKVMLLAALDFGAFFIPNNVIIAVGPVVLVASGLFLLLQLIYLIDLAYNISSYLLDKIANAGDDAEERQWIAVLAGFTLTAAIGWLTSLILMGIWYAPANCRLHQTWISLQGIIGGVLLLLSIHPMVQERQPASGLPCALIVLLYALYLIYSALVSEPPENDFIVCNPFATKQSTTVTDEWVSALLTLLSIIYTTTSTGSRSVSDSESQPLLGSESNDNAPTVVDDEESGVQYSYSFFHFIYALAILYLAALLTHWQAVGYGETMPEEGVTIGRHWAVVWVKVVCAWVVQVLYGWTLVAPVIWADRDFV